MDKRTLKTWVYERAEAIAEELHMEVVHVSLKKEDKMPLVEILLYKQDGLTLDDCATYNRRISAIFDEADMIDDAYLLEVSSPGLDWPIKTDHDYRRNKGKLLEAKLYRQVQGNKIYVGVLDSYDEKNLNLLVEGALVNLERANVAKLTQAIVF